MIRKVGTKSVNVTNSETFLVHFLPNQIMLLFIVTDQLYQVYKYIFPISYHLRKKDGTSAQIIETVIPPLKHYNQVLRFSNLTLSAS